MRRFLENVIGRATESELLLNSRADTRRESSTPKTSDDSSISEWEYPLIELGTIDQSNAVLSQCFYSLTSSLGFDHWTR
jgi:hypothetical protein